MIEESNTINQLNLALNELLDAYDELKGENDSLIAENAQLKKEVEDLSTKNETLEKDVSSLNNTTKHHTSEIDSMLGRIKSTLNSNPVASVVKENPENNSPISAPQATIKEEKPALTATVEKKPETPSEPTKEESQEKEEEKKDTKNNSKEIDLGRMQSLLSGFNN